MGKFSGWMLDGDVTTFFWFNRRLRNAFTDLLMPKLTHLGGAVFCIALCLSFLLNDDARWRHTGLTLAESLLASHVVVAICKRLLPRRRPFQALDQVYMGPRPLQDSSFPSGHATAAFSMAVILASTWSGASMIFFGLATAVACSRVYLGYHYPSDILIGGILGSMTSLILL